MSRTKMFPSKGSALLTPLPVFILCILATLAGANGPRSESDWPHWRGHGNDAIVTGSGLLDNAATHGFKVRWKADIGSGYSSISIAAGVAVTMFADDGFDYMAAFDAVTGEERWRYRIDETHLVSSVSGNEISRQQHLHCLFLTYISAQRYGRCRTK